ncbi:FHIPEP family type III secretion protein [bacterium]|nr:FHIPEP family type III secretion protein [bacterium]
MLDYVSYAEEMQKMCKDGISDKYSSEETDYILKTIINFTKLYGEKLNKEDEETFNDEQKKDIIREILKITFDKLLYLINAEIPVNYRDIILPQIASASFEELKKAFSKNIPQNKIEKEIEPKIQEIYGKCIDELDLTEEQKRRAKGFSKNFWLYIGILFLILIILFIPLFVFLGLKKFIITLGIIICITITIIKIIVNNFDKEVEKQKKRLEKIKKEMDDLGSPNSMYERLGSDVLSILVGAELEKMSDPEQDGLLIPKICSLRQRITDELGYIIPNVKIIASADLGVNEYLISVRCNMVAKGTVYFRKSMINSEQWIATGKAIPKEAIMAEDPITKESVFWIDSDIVQQENIYSIRADDEVLKHLKDVVIQRVDNILEESDVRKYIEIIETKNENPVLVENLLKKLNYCDIRRVLVNLVRERISIKDISFIFCRLDDYSRYNKEPDILSERIRKDLSRQISLSNSNKDGIIYAMTLSEELTDNLIKKVEFQKDFNKTKLSIKKQYELELVENIKNRLNENKHKFKIQPILVCHENLRLAMYRMLSFYIPNITVLTNNEIENDIQLKIVDTVQ